LSELGEDEFMQRTGKAVRGQWSLTKQRWLQRHGHGDGVVRRFGVAEFIVRMLGGEEASERSLASRTGWLDLEKDDWWDDALDFSGVQKSILPPLVSAGVGLGRIRADISRRFAGAVLTVAGHDHQAAAIGLGAIGTAAEVDSCGTAEALVRTVDPYVPPQTVLALARQGITTDWSVQPGLWSLLGGTEGGLSLRRVLALLGRDEGSLSELDRLAMRCSTDGLVVKTHAAGLSVSGITEASSPGGLWRAATTQAAREAYQMHRSMSELMQRAERVVLTGGWTRSTAFIEAKLRLMPDAEVSDVAVAGCRGAAILAGRAVGALDELAFDRVRSSTS
jgi:sugar (pentulose or hexulose) kinase